MEENIPEEELIYEDEYESINEQILSQLTLLNSHSSLANLHQKNEKKMNKLRLLLYQKFLNIIFSVITIKLKRAFNKIKASKNPFYYHNKTSKKYAPPSFYLKSLEKQKQREEKKKQIREYHLQIKQKKIEKNSVKKKTDYEIEYEKYTQQKKMEKQLEKINKEQREKYKNDLIKKEHYADSLYAFIAKRKFFKVLRYNLELGGVAKIFVENIKKRILKIHYIELMKFIAEDKKEKALKALEQKNKCSDLFYLRKLKEKIFYFLMNFSELSTNVGKYLKEELNKKLVKRIMIQMRQVTKSQNRKYSDMIREFRKGRAFVSKKRFFYQVLGFVKQKKEEEMKEEIMSKLKNKAKLLLGDFTDE